MVYLLVLISKVAPCWAQLALGWVTVNSSRYGTSHPGQLSLAIPLWVGTYE